MAKVSAHSQGVSRRCFFILSTVPDPLRSLNALNKDQNNRQYSSAKQWRETTTLSSPIQNEAGEFVCTYWVKGDGLIEPI